MAAHRRFGAQDFGAPEVTQVAIHPAAATPHVIEAEQIVIGTLLMHSDRIGQVIRAGGSDLFFDQFHARIFDAIRERDKANLLVSPVTMAEVMRNDAGMDALGGPGYFARLAGASSQAAFSGYVAMLSDARRKRDLALAMQEAQAAIARGEEEASAIAARLEASLIDISRTDEKQGPVSMLKAVTVAMDQVRAAHEGDDDEFVKSGILSLDSIITGFFPGEMVLLGGRPSMGKTGVALSVALNAAREGKSIGIVSLEMNPEALALRALSEATANARNAVPYSKMRRGEMSSPQLATLRQCARAVADLPVTFLPRQFSDIGALYSGAKQIARTSTLDMLIVDYAQLLRVQAKSRYEQITEVSIALKALAGDLNIPIMALSQLSRSIEGREDKRPMLSDLRESGQLEQDADTVLFCYRPEYYLERTKPRETDPMEDLQEWQDCMEKVRNRLEIIVAKQRQGEIGTAHVKFNPALNLIWEGY